MKFILALLLLIPSLSWGNEIVYNCEMLSENKGAFSETGIYETYIFDLEKKTLENIFSDGLTVKYSDIISISDEFIKFNSLGWYTGGIGELNKNNLKITISERFALDNGERIYNFIYYQCELLTNKIEDNKEKDLESLEVSEDEIFINIKNFIVSGYAINKIMSMCKEEHKEHDGKYILMSTLDAAFRENLLNENQTKKIEYLAIQSEIDTTKIIEKEGCDYSMMEIYIPHTMKMYNAQYNLNNLGILD